MWTAQDTTTHQDHVIAHVVGASVLGYFIFDESLYLVLDIGFIWQIYLDGEMGLLPTSVAIQELEADEAFKQRVKVESELLLNRDAIENEFTHVVRVPVSCMIEEVTFFVDGDRRRLVLSGEDGTLGVESSLSRREIHLALI